MNQEKIQQIENRITELERLSNGKGRLINGHFIVPEYLDEYSDLYDLRNLLEESKIRVNNIPYVTYKDVMIREDLLDDYKLLSSRVLLDGEVKKNNTGYTNLINSEHNPDSADEINPEYDGPVDPASALEPIKDTTVYIGNTRIPYPREKFNTETIEEYEDYLKEHFRPYGLVEEDVELYPGTNIPKPRGPYPHEDINDKDSYYNEYLKYMENKYTVKTEENNGKGKTDGKKKRLLVTKVRKATDFFKKHKRKVIVALGLAALAAAFVPGVIPALMYANSVLWHCSPAFLQGVLHGCNTFLATLVGATPTLGPAGEFIWMAGGSAINATAATGSLVSSLATAALGFTGTASIVASIKVTRDKIKERWKNRKNSKEDQQNKENIPTQNKNENQNSLINNIKNKLSNTLNKINTKDKDSSNENFKITFSNDEEVIKNKLTSEEILNKVDGLRDMYINLIQQNPQNGKYFASLLSEVNVMENILLRKNKKEEDTVTFENHEINVSEKEKLEELLEKHGIKFKKETKIEEPIIAPESEIAKKLKSPNILERVDGTVDLYIEKSKKEENSKDIIDNVLPELGKIAEILLNGKNAKERTNFEGYTIDLNKKDELENLLDKYNITYTKTQKDILGPDLPIKSDFESEKEYDEALKDYYNKIIMQEENEPEATLEKEGKSK